MDKKQYNNVIDWTLKHEAQAQSEDSLEVTRAICNELGVALPQGDLAQVAEVLATDDYMGWKACTKEEAQEAANSGIPAIGISNDQIIMLAAEDEEQPVCNAVAVMMLNENNVSYAMNSLQYYVYGGGTTNSHITVAGWLKMYTNPTCSGTCRVVNIPTVESFTGEDHNKYEFTNRNYWYAFEPAYKKTLISSAFVDSFNAMGKSWTVSVGSCGECIDENGRYWMAVGPKVIIPDFEDDETCYADDFAGKGVFDIVVKDKFGKKYYIPGVAGDIKNHTWNNGIIQTFKAYPEGDFTSAGENFNGTVAAEFIGNLKDKLSPLGQYSIDSIRFYPN